MRVMCGEKQTNKQTCDDEFNGVFSRPQHFIFALCGAGLLP